MRFLSNCHERVSILYECDAQNQDTVAVTLRRWIANPLLFERVSSNLTGVVFLLQPPPHATLCTLSSFVLTEQHTSSKIRIQLQPLVNIYVCMFDRPLKIPPK